MRIPAFSDTIPNSALGAWLALFVVFCSSCQTVIGVLIYVTHHPNHVVLVHGKPVVAPVGPMFFLLLIPALGGMLLFYLSRQKNWARKWTLGWIAVTLALNAWGLLRDAQHYRLGFDIPLLLIAALLLLTSESKKWFLPDRSM